jgi:hypothetical protein
VVLCLLLGAFARPGLLAKTSAGAIHPTAMVATAGSSA